MLRVVLDVNVLVSAFLSPRGIPAAVVSAWRDGKFDLVLSAALVREFEEVTLRPHLVARFAGNDPRAYVSDIRRNAVVVDDPPPAQHVPDDPDDDYLIGLALAASAHAIVSGDAVLLGLELDTPRILSPRDFLVVLERTD